MDILAHFLKLKRNRLLDINISLVMENFTSLTFLVIIIIFNLIFLSFELIKSISISISRKLT